MAPESTAIPRLQADAGLIALIASALLMVFALNVLLQAIPLQILNPAWQLRLVGSITANSGFAITGFALLHLAANLDPLNQRLADRRRFARRWALAAAIGFLLLIPLQLNAVWSGISATKAEQVRQRNTTSQGIQRVRQAVVRATSLADLQQQLVAVRGPSLTANALQRPLPEVKRALLQEADRLDQELRTSPLGPRGGDVWALLQENLRTVLLALLFCFCFAAGSQLPGAAAPSTTGLPPTEELPLLAWINRGLSRKWRRLRYGLPSADSSASTNPGSSDPAGARGLAGLLGSKLNRKRPRDTSKARKRWRQGRY